MQLGKKFKRGPAVEELPEYMRATHFLGTLGMQNYQKNLKRGLLNDSTIHLWNDRYNYIRFCKFAICGMLGSFDMLHSLPCQ